MKEYLNNRKKIILSLIYSVLLMFCGGTLARWVWESIDNQRTDIVFSIQDQEGGYSCSADGGGEIIANEAVIMPASCTSSENVIMREISTSVEIEKKGIEVVFDLWLDVNNIGIPLTESTNFKYVVTNSATSCTTGVLSTGNFNGKISGSKVNIFNERFLSSDSKKLYLYIWLDEEETNVETANQNFNLSLNGSCSGISSNIEAPVLDDGMIPVVISDDGMVTTIDKNDENWYDYSQQKWANIVLVNEKATSGVDGSQSRDYYLNNDDVVVNSVDILAYYTWIPRYKYKLWSINGNNITEPQTIDILFESKSESFSNGTTIGSYRTHPAFWWDFNSDGNMSRNEMLPGIWVGKFETTGTSDNPTVLPNTTSLVNQYVSTQFQTSLKFAGGIMNTSTGDVLFDGNNSYGLTTEIDSHMMKNSEWGAVAYLSHSKYGINDKIRLNNYYNNGTKTGCGASSDNGAESTSCQIAYAGASSYPQSTSGNISGVFDMSGGAFEYVMGNYDNVSKSSGFDVFPKRKYYDLYLSSQFTGDNSTNMQMCTLDTCGGHALYETAYWYTNASGFVDEESPWFLRIGVNDGSFLTSEFSSTYVFGYYANYISFRSVLVPVKAKMITLDINGGSLTSSSAFVSYTTPGEYEFMVPYDGKYRLEVWGAKGGAVTGGSNGGTISTITPGYGGYSTGNVTLNKGEILYVNVGGKGTDNCVAPSNGTVLTCAGGYNGGGTGYSSDYYRYVGGGGGATHIATISGLLSTLSSSIESILIVAGGGGGSGYYNYDSANQKGFGGAGGGYSGNNGNINGSTSTISLGGTQNTGFIFGQGQTPTTNSSNHSLAGGGGGYYGGNSGSTVSIGAGGGSGYIGNSLLTDKAMYCYNCLTSSDVNTLTYSTTNVYSDAISKYAKNGDGAAILTLLGRDFKNVIPGEEYGELPEPYRYGYEFTGWYTEKNGGQLVNSSTVVSQNQNHTLYARWEALDEYIVSYDANGGSGAPENQIKYHGQTLILSSTKPIRNGYKFLGWSEDKNATSATYNAGGNYTKNASRLLYAIWEIFPLNSYSCANGNSGSDTYLFTYTGNCTMIDDGAGNWRVKFLTSGTFTSTANVLVETFLVGGGGGGSTSGTTSGGGGGGGGYTTTSFLILKQDQSYSLTIGAGGSVGVNGKNTVGFGLMAVGGYSGLHYTGGSGGSGGGGGGDDHGTAGGTGGSNGGNGTTKYGNGGAGQGITTREFGESSGTLYSGGGGGGYGRDNDGTSSRGSGGSGGGATGGSSATANTGGGGGGADARQSNGGTGGSGIIVIRNARKEYDYSKVDFNYTGNYIYIDEGSGNWKIKFLTSGTFTVSNDIVIDAFLVGGGGGGGASDVVNGGGGGGGGYTTTATSISINSATPYNIVVGAGGARTVNGVNTEAFGNTANGGKAGSGTSGGAGGSGGGGGGHYHGTSGGSGGSNGGNGTTKYGSGGTGQLASTGMNTREFGDTSLTLYSGGGGGGYGRDNDGTSSPGGGGSGGGARGGQWAPQTTGGGGGGDNARQTNGGTGGSGIVVIRNKRDNT